MPVLLGLLQAPTLQKMIWNKEQPQLALEATMLLQLQDLQLEWLSF